MDVEQHAHELALLYMGRYMEKRDVDEPQQLVAVYKQVYMQYLSELSPHPEN